MSGRRSFLTRAWLAGSIAYGCLRAVLVWTFLSGYGVNPWAYAFVELASSVVYGLMSGRAVLDLIDRDWRRLRTHGPLAIASYFAPDAFVFITVGGVPRGLLATIVAIVVVSAVITVVGTVRTVVRGRLS